MNYMYEFKKIGFFYFYVTVLRKARSFDYSRALPTPDISGSEMDLFGH